MTDPILIDFPNKIETKRLILRAARPGDGAAVHLAVQESQDFLKDWMPWAVNIPDAEGYEKWARENHISFTSRTNLTMIMIAKESGKIVGGTGFHNLDWDVPSFEIGYWVHSSYTGRGYVTEAVEALTDFAFNELNAERVEIRCDANNERSAAVALRNGYHQDALLKNNRRHHVSNDLVSTLVFSKVKEIG